MKPGIYAGLPMADYLAMPAVSASNLRAILDRCPYAAWWDSWLNPARPVETSGKVQDAGSIAHGILLEGSTDGVAVIDPNDYPAEKTGNIPDGWTNKAIRTARDDARASGLIPVLKDQMSVIEDMVDAAWAFIGHSDILLPVFQPDGGESELTMVWDDAGTPCRIRPDRIARDRSMIVDYKTGGTSAEPNQWGRTQMIRMGYYVSAAFYRRGVSVLCDGILPEYYFLTQEQEEPYLCSLVGVDATHFAIGTSKIEAALATWRECVKTGYFAQYPSFPVFPELPTWATAQWEEQIALQQIDLEASTQP